MNTRLSKSRYVAGLQCSRMLWWQVYEPEANDERVQALFKRGHVVGLAARDFVPGGVLIDLPPTQVAERVAATADAIKAGVSVIYEASFLEDDVFVSVDILERRQSGFAIVEVKAALDIKDHYIPDVGIQLYVLNRAGIDVERVELMHLNRECSHPNLSNLFVREDVTALAKEAAKSAPEIIKVLVASLSGPLPQVAVGEHCSDPYECAFRQRCWPELPQHHVSSLYRVSAKNLAMFATSGCNTLHDVPHDFGAKGPARRQIDSVQSGNIVVEPGLASALGAIVAPLAFLDFETVAPAIPVWPGCTPYRMVPVQFSCHRITPGGLVHYAWLAEGPDDPREPFARALIEACDGAATILVYNAPFEKARIESLMTRLPSLKTKLEEISNRFVDLLPIVRDHVYHPDFNGSFSIKAVLPALVPGMGYEDLDIQGGEKATAALEALIFDATMEPSARTTLRRQLLDYCERDTLAMVRLLERLRTLV